MKTFILTLALLVGAIFSATAQTNSNHVYVDGYYKTNGTYVQGHYRTAPNNTINDNFSTYPNVNPYTGDVGTIKPKSYYTPKVQSYEITPIVSQPKYVTPTYTTPSYSYPY